MELSAHLHHLEADGSIISRLCRQGELSAPVPSCPDWTVESLLRHLSGVHRWAATTVGEESSDRPAFGEPPDELSSTGLVDWFDEGLEQLLRTLSVARLDLSCWTFLPAPSPLQFWARRQAHETAMHRVDVEQAFSASTSMDAPFAADGIDELLVGFGGRLQPPERLGSLLVTATDTGHRWLVELAPPKVRATTASEVVADATLAGPAEELYLVLWNRREPAPGSLEGDATVLSAWRQLAKI